MFVLIVTTCNAKNEIKQTLQRQQTEILSSLGVKHLSKNTKKSLSKQWFPGPKSADYDLTFNTDYGYYVTGDEASGLERQ